MKNILVSKSNHLIQASYRLTLNEQRLVLACIGQLDGRRPMPPEKMFSITADDFAEMSSLSIDKAYVHLREAAENLYSRTITKIEGEVRDQVKEALADTRPAVPHQQVMDEAQALIDRKCRRA